MAISNRYKLRRACQYVFQLVIMVVGKILFMPVTRRHTQLAKDLHRQPVIIIANHKRALDPFVTMTVLPYRMLRQFMPVGFMTHNAFYDSPLRPFLWLSGCFPARNPHGKHKISGVAGSIDLLQNGSSVFIFPEGTRVRNATRGPAHPGVIRIHQGAPQAPLLLCHTRYNNGLRALLQGRRFEITYKIIQHPRFDDPEKIMDELFAL